MAIYIPPKNPKNKRFNVLDFNNNNIDYSIYDERYLRLFGTNNILSINKFYGITEFFNNINSFMYLSILKVLSIGNSILSPLLITDQIQTMELQTNLINGIPYTPVGIWLIISGIQYPIIKSISDASEIFGGLDLSQLINNSSVLLYPNYSIRFYTGRSEPSESNNILLCSIENTTNDIFFSNVIFNYNFPCGRIIICYNRKKII
jgi:hypothetical protein